MTVPKPLKKAIANATTEAELTETIISIAHLFGWLAHHSRPSRDRGGQWKTALSGDKGLPDLILARKGRVIFAELKSERGTFGEGQPDWLAALGYHTIGEMDQVVDPDRNPEVYVWRPRDLDEITEILR